jgi:hypothetical protein
MGTNAVVFAWNRPLPGREAMSAKHFQEFLAYLAEQKKRGWVESFDTVLLEPHGGTFNGFFLVRGEPAKLAQLADDADWIRHQIRADLHLDGFASLRGMTGAAVEERIGLWMNELPR